nr:YcaO-like family protein [Heyndrickxia oleronia]
MQIYNKKPSPFILSTLNINKSIFSNDPHLCTVKSFVHSEAHGSSSGNMTLNTIKAALGESQERIALFYSLKKDKECIGNTKQVAFNLLDGSIIDVPHHLLYLNYDLPVFKFDKGKENFISDSCGVAAHNFSADCIEKAFFEFIERQCLIHNWLSKGEGRKIPLNSLKDEMVKKKINLLKQYFEDIHILDISLFKGISVVIIIAVNENVYSVGLGSNFKRDYAISSALNEFNMIFGSVINKYKKDRKISSNNIYVEQFYNMSREDFLIGYDYLINSQKEAENIPYENQGINHVLKKIKEDFDMNIYATFIPIEFNCINTKVVKVFSPDGYPHMHTKSLDPYKYKISKMLPNNNFPNLGKPIPIP